MVYFLRSTKQTTRHTARVGNEQEASPPYCRRDVFGEGAKQLVLSGCLQLFEFDDLDPVAASTADGLPASWESGLTSTKVPSGRGAVAPF
jgi:hypothetical protein